MQITIHNIQTIQEEGCWYKIGGEIRLDDQLDRLQIERIATLFSIPMEKLYMAPGITDPYALQYIMRKFIEYVITADLEERRKQS